ncbi:MAG: transposase [Candidatus Baltobacteraceae bacterium]
MESNTEVRPRRKLRSFTAETKVRVLAEYDAATTPLVRAALMCREGIYSSLISNWRKQGSRVSGVNRLIHMGNTR